MEIYTDGSCLSNPGGPGGAAAILINADGNTIVSSFYPSTTNNRMELEAIKLALQLAFCQANFDLNIVIYSDSQYAINCVNGTYKPKANLDLIQPIKSMLSRLKGVSFVWVKAHAGNEWNEFVDKLAYSTATQSIHSHIQNVK